MTREDYLEALRHVSDAIGSTEAHLRRVSHLAPDGECHEHTLAVASALSAQKHQLRALVARSLSAEVPAAPALTTLEVGALRVDRAALAANVDGVPVALDNKGFQLLTVLASEPTRMFTKEEIYRALYEAVAMPEATRRVDTHACRLRTRLAAAGFHGVISVWGKGYRLVNPDPVALHAVA